MADLWGRTDQILAGGLSSDSMFVSWPELAAVGGGLGLLIQQIHLEYTQPVRRVYEIGPGVIPLPLLGFVSASGINCLDPGNAVVCAARTQPTYYIIGRPEGTLQFGRFIGPNALTACFYRKYGSPCSTNLMTISGAAGCSASDPSAVQIAWTLNGVLLNREAVDITGQEMVMQEQLSAMFVGLDLAINGVTNPVCDPVTQTQ